MIRFVAISLSAILLSSSLTAAESGYKVTYDGGSVENVKAGNGIRLYLDSKQIRMSKDKAELTNIPASAVTEISYGQDVHRRVGAAIGIGVVTLGVGALMALTKSKKHFVGESALKVAVGEGRQKFTSSTTGLEAWIANQSLSVTA